MTTDKGIHDHINELIAEEHELREKLGRREVSPDEEHARVKQLETELDQAWDLLRQRSALRNAGGSPDDAAERPAGVVETYLS